MAQNPGPGTTDLTSSSIVYTNLDGGGVNHWNIALASCISNVCLEHSGRKVGTVYRGTGRPTASDYQAEALVSGTRYEYEVIDHGQASVAASVAPALRVVIRNAVTRAIIHDAIFLYTAVMGVSYVGTFTGAKLN